MELTPDGTGFDLATTARAIAQNTASLPADIGTVDEVLRAAGIDTSGGGGGGNNGGGGGGGGGGGSSSGPSKLPALDWATTYFTSLGLPADVAKKVNDIFTQYSDVNSASAAALGYIRGTDWYVQTYPGIAAGIAKGVVSNEADYRSYLNQANQMYRQFYGRDISSSEFSNILASGVDISTLGRQLNAGTYRTTYGQESFSNLFTSDELQAMSNESAGLGTAQGKYLLDLHQYAQQVAPIFAQYGQTADRTNIENLFKAGLSADTVGRQLAGQAYIGANRGDIQYAAGNFGDGALSQDDLNALGANEAGLTSPRGMILQRALDRANQRLQGVFNGQLGTMPLTLSGGRLASQKTVAQRPDVAA